MFNEKWFVKNIKADYKSMSKRYGISELMCRLMVNRNIIDDDMIKSYVHPDISMLHNPHDMKDLTKAVHILKEKIDNNKKIRIVGDYDVDGVISVYILYTALKKCGANVDYEIPDRIKDGYGINVNIIKDAKNDDVDTILTCDNGIAAIDAIKYAKDEGMTVIVTDHHDIPFVEDENNNRKTISSEADAILNPKQEECKYKFKKLCGAGVAFKLISALYEETGISKEEILEYIEFLAIATVCDVVDLVDENRVFVKMGLERINNTSNIGLRQLMKENEIDNKKISTYHLGFIIGPCINACGRLDNAKRGLKMLLSEDENHAIEYAKELVELNKERKDMTHDGVEEAIKKIESTSIVNDKIIVVYLPHIHESLAGIIAGRIRERYNKPTFVLTKGEEFVKGSGRSIEEYNMFEGLVSCGELLEKFGGHPMAAGLSLKEENIDDFRIKLNGNTGLSEDDLLKKITVDAALNLDDINYDLIEDLHKLEPFGKGNEKALFGVKNVDIIKVQILGKNNNVLKLKLKTPKNKAMDAVYFGNIEQFENTITEKYDSIQLARLYDGTYNHVHLDFIFYPSVNEYNGNVSIQIVVESYR